MSPLFIKMRPEDNVTVDMRDVTPSESVIVLDYASCANHSRTDSSSAPLEHIVQHNTVPEHDNDDGMQTVCDSQQPSSSNELYDKSKEDNDSNEMCKPETSVESTKTDLITDTSENAIKHSNIVDLCDTSQIVSSQRNSECADLTLSVRQNTTACSMQSPDSSTTVDWITKLPDKPQKLALNKKKLGEVPKPKTKFNVHNFIKSKVRKKSAVVQEILQQSDVTENTFSNVDSEKEICNFKNTDTKSRHKVRKVRDAAVKEPSTMESKTKALIKEQNILDDKKHGRKKVTKTLLKPKMNLDKNEDAVSSLEGVEYPEDTHTDRSRRKSTSKIKQKPNSVKRDEPAVPVNVTNATGTTNKKNKMKLSKNVKTKPSRKYVLEDTSDEEESSVFENIESKFPIESSTTEAASKLDENEMPKNNGVSKKTKKEDTQKNFDSTYENHTGKAKLIKKIKLDGYRKTPVRKTEHFVVQSKSKLADKKPSSKLENLEPKMKLSKNVKTKPSRKYVLEDTSDEEESSVFENIESKFPIESSTTEAASKLDENEMLKNNGVSKKTETEDTQKKFDNHTGKAKLIKKIKLNGNRKTTVRKTEHFVVQSKSKIADKKPSSKLENLELKLPTLPVTIETAKIPKLYEKCGTNLKNKEQREENPTKIDEHENSALKSVKLSENWNVRPISPVLKTIETLPQRWAETGLIAPVNKNSDHELRHSTPQLSRICNNELNLQEPSETVLFDNQNSQGTFGLVNSLANVSTVVSGISKLSVKEETLTRIKSHRMIQPNCQISLNTSKETKIANEHLVVDGVTEIMPSAEHTASNNYAMQFRAVNLQTPFHIPTVPPEKRIRINRNTSIVKQTLPAKTTIDYDSSAHDEDGMEKEVRNICEEFAASKKHSFNFVDRTVTPTETKRNCRVKILRPDMSDIVTSNVKRNTLEDDSISIYADSPRNDATSDKKYCGLDDLDNEDPSNTNDIVSELVRHTSGHVTDNSTPQNTNTKTEERDRPIKRGRIYYNMSGEDEALPPISNSVIETTENTTKRPCRSHNQDTLYVFDRMCKKKIVKGNCPNRRCIYPHQLPRDWEITLQNMPKESLRNLYNNVKNGEKLYLFKKIFPIVVKQLVSQRDFNNVISLVTDVLEINLDSDRSPYINVVIDALRDIGISFNSAIDVIFKGTVVERRLKDQLTDILIYICTERGDIASSWSTMQTLMNYRNYHLDAGIIKTILNECTRESKLQKELCLQVYSDLIPRISDDELSSKFKCLLDDYLECMRTLGLANEAQALSERIVALSVRSSKFVPEVRPIPRFNIQFPVPPKLSPPSTFTRIAKHNSSPKCNAPYMRPIGNNVMPCNNNPALLKDALVDKELSNVPSTSATVAPYVEEIQTHTVKQAIFTENVPQLMSLICEYKGGHLTDEFLKVCLDAMQESAYNFAVLFRNLCKSATDVQSEQYVKMDKSLEYVFQTIGYNLIIYSTNNNEWEQAWSIYQTLRDLYNNSDIKDIKMFTVDKLSYIKRLLIICRIFIKHGDRRHAWKLFRVNSLHTSSCWTEDADQQDIQYRDLVFTELMTGLDKESQWETTFTIIEYILQNNINELDPIVDSTLEMAADNDCYAEYIISLMSVCPVWYKRIRCRTLRVIAVKLVRDHMYSKALTVYKQGCEMKIYPHFVGNEKSLVFSSHYVLEEILLMLKVFLQNMVNFMPVIHAVVIRVRHAAEVRGETGTTMPSLLYQNSMSKETMHARIANVLNNYIKPPIRVVNKYSQLEIAPAELQKHLQVHRKCGQFS